MGAKFMRLRDIPFENGNLKVDIKRGEETFIVVYCQGEAKLTYLPEHGETKVITHQGRVKRIRFEEGEEF